MMVLTSSMDQSIGGFLAEGAMRKCIWVEDTEHGSTALKGILSQISSCPSISLLPGRQKVSSTFPHVIIFLPQ